MVSNLKTFLMVPVTGTLSRKKKNEVACSENIIHILSD